MVEPITQQETHDAEDVAAILSRETADGPGTDDLDSLPEGDFVSYEDADAENAELTIVVFVPVDEDDDK